ncbi:uncharacterized protein LOC124205681 isoform X1 [Daphnia pulex]|uniref:uncharacterized protein LOC124205681 isoform X1 n=1 Tax=Daphnia pulex TaxID=6669 RepID=UPI001EDE23C2|nr:uncharacterized protein LOC124205681 isoform X1 [Daphnia pulex]XP_046459109.1 uncharacterized protein LOC124205681 isoform X1 [Daphnia pulex]
MLALIFLPALAIASHQKFQRPMHWLPYPSPDYLRHQVIPYEANRFRDGNIFTQPTQPLPELGGDPQGRLNNKWKLKNALDVGYLFGQFKQYQQYPQYYNPHQKTVTLVVTTTINVTTSQSCIPATQFANFGWSMSNVCTHSPRKKRGVLQESSAVEDPISIEPSDPEQVVMTTLPGDVQMERRNRHLLYDPDLFISSSKDDVIVMDQDEPGLEEYPKREKRLYYLVATTTVVTFLVNTFTTLKKISLAYGYNLVCRPSEIPVCME